MWLIWPSPWDSGMLTEIWACIKIKKVSDNIITQCFYIYGLSRHTPTGPVISTFLIQAVKSAIWWILVSSHCAAPHYHKSWGLGYFMQIRSIWHNAQNSGNFWKSIKTVCLSEMRENSADVFKKWISLNYSDTKESLLWSYQRLHSTCQSSSTSSSSKSVTQQESRL